MIRTSSIPLIPIEAEGMVDAAFLIAKDKLHSIPHEDVYPMVAFMRKGDVISIVICNRIDRDAALAVAALGSFGYQPDAISTTLASSHTKTMINPLTGKHWNKGEMQQVLEKDSGLGGLVQDSVSYSEVRKDGREFFLCRDFDRDPETGFMSSKGWGEGIRYDSREGNDVLGGHILDTLRTCLHEDPLSTLNPEGAEHVRRSFAFLMAQSPHMLPAMSEREARDRTTNGFLLAMGNVVMYRDPS